MLHLKQLLARTIAINNMVVENMSLLLILNNQNKHNIKFAIITRALKYPLFAKRIKHPRSNIGKYNKISLHLELQKNLTRRVYPKNSITFKFSNTLHLKQKDTQYVAYHTTRHHAKGKIVTTEIMLPSHTPIVQKKISLCKYYTPKISRKHTIGHTIALAFALILLRKHKLRGMSYYTHPNLHPNHYHNLSHYTRRRASI